MTLQTVGPVGGDCAIDSENRQHGMEVVKTPVCRGKWSYGLKGCSMEGRGAQN